MNIDTCTTCIENMLGFVLCILNGATCISFKALYSDIAICFKPHVILLVVYALSHERQSKFSNVLCFRGDGSPGDTKERTQGVQTPGYRTLVHGRWRRYGGVTPPQPGEGHAYTLSTYTGESQAVKFGGDLSWSNIASA